jgi:hypothetical protein
MNIIKEMEDYFEKVKCTHPESYSIEDEIRCLFRKCNGCVLKNIYKEKNNEKFLEYKEKLQLEIEIDYFIKQKKCTCKFCPITESDSSTSKKIYVFSPCKSCFIEHINITKIDGITYFQERLGFIDNNCSYCKILNLINSGFLWRNINVNQYNFHIKELEEMKSFIC